MDVEETHSEEEQKEEIEPVETGTKGYLSDVPPEDEDRAGEAADQTPSETMEGGNPAWYLPGRRPRFPDSSFPDKKQGSNSAGTPTGRKPSCALSAPFGWAGPANIR